MVQTPAPPVGAPLDTTVPQDNDYYSVGPTGPYTSPTPDHYPHSPTPYPSHHCTCTGRPSASPSPTTAHSHHPHSPTPSGSTMVSLPVTGTAYLLPTAGAGVLICLLGVLVLLAGRRHRGATG